jgi:predicted Zn-dependent protease with MMP-like domain
MTTIAPATIALYPGLHPPNLRLAVLEPIKPILRAAGVAAFVVGTILFLLNPPSLSGAEELIGFVAGAVALILLTAWATVTLGGRRQLDEPEFERVVQRAELLGERGAGGREPTDFERMVGEAIERLPEEFRQLVDDTPVVVSSRGREAGAYGHYFGDTVARENYADRIIVYQDTLERDFGHDPELLARQVERTLRHELAHHLGWEERGVRDLGL